MLPRSRTVLVAASAALLATLSGCALVTPRADEEPVSPIAQCVMGHTWTLDNADLGTQLLAELQRDHPEVTTVDVGGSKSIEWGEDHTVTIDSDLTITVTATTATPDQNLVLTQTQSGSATGRAYVDTDVAIPRNWNDEITVETTGQQADTALEALPWGLPATAFDDTVGWELTCDGGTMTLHPRGNGVVQRWTTG